MLKVIEVVFDGKTFVPTGPVDLPTGTKANVEVPEPSGAARSLSVGPPPAPATEAQKQEWERLRRQWAAAALPWATVDEAVAAMRGPSWPEPPGGGS